MVKPGKKGFDGINRIQTQNNQEFQINTNVVPNKRSVKLYTMENSDYDERDYPHKIIVNPE